MENREMTEYKVMLVRDREHTYQKANSPTEVEAILRAMGADKEVQESVWVLYLDAQLQVTGVERIAKGGLNGACIDPRDIFRGALLHAAAKIIIAHNHPSGDTRPSDADMLTTRQITSAGELLGIDVTDSVIIGHDFLSLREAGMWPRNT